ncbi:hypothetical protein [Acidipropionibacterium virtanenii]|uniref:Uncharacterized protein n=1 Tax=Acidipropionibacterium virtanenii TaxID=2057246 RepID=A0A344UR21_9ACTN|nr:hypothetical protein [Acidipropionibacterium virtanenii]AXE37719.1 hypothetical protein JS278_00526 [Acidipropionibacterium virtanenii]
MHRITITTGSGRFMIEGSKREIQEIAEGIARSFSRDSGAWLAHGDRTVWIPAISQVKIDLAGSELPGLESTRVGTIKSCIAPMH